MTTTRKPCPQCREEGRDTKGDNLHVYADGGMYCHGGHGVIRSTELNQNSDLDPKDKAMESKLPIADCMANTVGHDPARGISPAVIADYDVRIEYDVVAGTPKRVFYPYKTSPSKVIGVKIRKYPKEFYSTGTLGTFFGAHLIPSKTAVALFLTEGEEDALALKQIFSSGSLRNNHVMSLPNGASTGGIDPVFKAQQELLQRFKKVYLCFDSDAPGRATAKTVGSYLTSMGIETYVVEAGDELKDASDWLTSGRGEDLCDIIRKTQRFTPEGIVHGSEISIEEITRSAPVGYSTPFPDLDKKLRGFRKGELVTVCAGSGIGKSTLVKEIGYDMVTRHGLSVCHIALEDRMEALAGSYIAMDNNVPSSLFRENSGVLTSEQIKNSHDRTVSKMYFFNHFGSVETNEFKSTLMFYARSGVDFIILDHLSMVISGSDVANERKEIDKVMTDLAKMVVNTGVGLISVVHLKRRESREGGKSLNEGGSVSLTDLRGSAALEQLSWAVVAMERDQQAEDGTEDYASVRVLKNRTWGFTGKAGRVRYCHKTGRLQDAPELPEGEILNEEAHDIDTPEEVLFTEGESLSREEEGSQPESKSEPKPEPESEITEKESSSQELYDILSCINDALQKDSI